MPPMTDNVDIGLRRVLKRVCEQDPSARKGVSRLASMLGVTRSAISQWRRVPLERVPDVARLTGLAEHEIRPDHYRRPAA